jgi:predicted acylesterase/phospholipase RssA
MHKMSAETQVAEPEAEAGPKHECVHRFALSISGGIALGAYEAGVLTQLYRDLSVFNAQMKGRACVSIDAIAGASAGSITGLILAQALALGSPPERLEAHMRACWVDLLDIHHLLAPATDPATASGALFTDGVVEKIIAQVLDLAPDAPAVPQEAVALWITMTNLDGIPFVIDFERTDERHAQVATELYALDYKDYIPFVLEGNRATQVEQRLLPNDGSAADPSDISAGWRLTAEAARASSAFPLAFPCRYQKRNLEAYEGYRGFRKELKEGLAAKAADPTLHPTQELPTEATMQFVDGGLFNNEPIGRAIDAVAYINTRHPKRNPARKDLNGGKAERSFLMIEPEPQLPTEIAAALSTPVPSAPLLPPAILTKILAAYFNHALYSDFKTAQDTNTQIIRMNKAFDRLDKLSLPPEECKQLKQEILEAAGLDGKEIVTLQRIPQAAAVARRLASAFGGHFGGFLRRDYRVADFITGKHEARSWLSVWLNRWLQDHASDVGLEGKTEDEIEAFTVTQLGEAPMEPQDAHIADSGELDPKGLTPMQLADAGWFPVRHATDIQQQAALTEAQRRKIISEAETRLHQLLNAWLHPNWFGEIVLDRSMDWWLDNKYIQAPKD